MWSNLSVMVDGMYSQGNNRIKCEKNRKKKRLHWSKKVSKVEEERFKEAIVASSNIACQKPKGINRLRRDIVISDTNAMMEF